MLILFFAQVANAESTTFKTFTPFTPQQAFYYNGFNPNPPYPNPYYNNGNHQLSNLEQKILNKRYTYDNPESRIARMEQQVFGSTQTGNLPQRYQNLQNYLNTNNPYNDNYYNTKKKQTFWKAFSNIFGAGQITGFTPAYSSYDNPYGYQQGWTDANGDYYYNNYNQENRATVRILD